MRILVTGTAGFIGFHVARRLIADGHLVVGFDGMTPYYDINLKKRAASKYWQKPTVIAIMKGCLRTRQR